VQNVKVRDVVAVGADQKNKLDKDRSPQTHIQHSHVPITV